MVEPITTALAVASFLASIGGAVAANSGNKETKIQKQKRKLVDDLIASLNGNGSFNDLYNTSPEAFNKSFVEPAKTRFNNQIAPQIQQKFVNAGLHRGTGLDDALSRAGVDLDQMLNEQYMDYMNQGNNRKQNAINSILGAPPGQNETSGWQAAGQGAAGWASNPEIWQLLASMQSNGNQNVPTVTVQRKGFEPDKNLFQ